MKHITLIAAFTALFPPPGFAASQPNAEAAPPAWIDGKNPAGRMDGLLRYCLTVDPGRVNEARQVMIPCAARIYAGKDVNAMLAKWQQVASAVYLSSKTRLDANPKDNNARNPFEKHALIHAYLICRDKATIPQAIIGVMKQYVALYKHREWFGYGALNYRVMNDGAGFIAAELWPDLKDADGLDANGIQAATKARLFGYFDDIVRHNTGEYGAPTYLGIDLSAIKMLADYASDPEMKKRASLTLDSMLLQVACAWNSGYYVTPASRAKYWGSSTTGPDALDTTGGIAWLYFGGLRPVDPAHMNPGGSFWFAVTKDYHPPDLFTAVANDRANAFVHRGSVGDNIRFTIYHARGYSLASEWEFLKDQNSGHYKESRRNMFKWVSNRPDSTFVPLQENAQRPYRLSDHTPNAFGYGENPFSQSLQHEGTFIGISSAPGDYPFWKMYAPFTKNGAILKRVEKNNWVFCHGGPVLFAFRYVQPSYWDKPRAKENCDILKSDSRNNGWVLETSPLQPYAGGGPDAELERFANAVLAKTKLDASAIDAAKPKITYLSLGGHRLELTYRAHKEPYTGQHVIDGKPVDYSSFPLFGNPWVTQPLGGDVLTIRHGTDGITYNFKNWTVTQNNR